jgi:hypothetical protein
MNRLARPNEQIVSDRADSAIDGGTATCTGVGLGFVNPVPS